MKQMLAIVFALTMVLCGSSAFADFPHYSVGYFQFPGHFACTPGKNLWISACVASYAPDTTYMTFEVEAQDYNEHAYECEDCEEWTVSNPDYDPIGYGCETGFIKALGVYWAWDDHKSAHTSATSAKNVAISHLLACPYCYTTMYGDYVPCLQSGCTRCN